MWSWYWGMLVAVDHANRARDSNLCIPTTCQGRGVTPNKLYPPPWRSLHTTSILSLVCPIPHLVDRKLVTWWKCYMARAPACSSTGLQFAFAYLASDCNSKTSAQCILSRWVTGLNLFFNLCGTLRYPYPKEKKLVVRNTNRETSKQALKTKGGSASYSE